MIKKFLILSSVFLISNIGFAGNCTSRGENCVSAPGVHELIEVLDLGTQVEFWHSENNRPLVLGQWEYETVDAALKNIDPDYLFLISLFVKSKLNEFAKNKEQDTWTKKNWIWHAYSLLFTMRAYNQVAWSIVCVYSYNATYSPSCNTLNSAFKTANHAVWDAGYNSAFDAAKNGAWMAALEVFKGTDFNATWMAAESAIRVTDSIDQNFLERLTYRVAEKTVLLSCLDNFEQIASASYEWSINEIKKVPRSEFFKSQAEWEEFKLRYFSEVKNNPVSYYFLKPWIKKLEQIADKIDS